MKRILCIGCFGFFFTITTYAAAQSNGLETTGVESKGPTARELQKRGNDVAVPQRRPLETTKQAVSSKPDTPTQASKKETPKNTSNDASKAATFQEDQTCFNQLSKLAIVEATQSPEVKDLACVIPHPVKLSSTTGNHPVSFPSNLVLDCKFALAFVRHVGDVVEPLALAHIGSSLKQISTGPGFTCRRRNNAPTGKLSEHAFGNAIDVIAYKFKDHPDLVVERPEDMPDNQRRFFSAVRKSACGYFTTVLGPGSNAAHASHLHFDLGRTGQKKNPYRICE